MNGGYRRCTLCPEGSAFEEAADAHKVRSNVRRFRDQTFTVWRCRGCGCLHCLEDIDYAAYYADYPLKRQRLDFFTRRMYSSRLALLARAGLRRDHRILDYGCGNGAFVRFLRERGYAGAAGYDPYSTAFADPAALDARYDLVTTQDVIEHAPDPIAFLDRVTALVIRPGGLLAVGTPDASEIDLRAPLDVVGQLHQPYHRHLLTRAWLAREIEARGFRIAAEVRRWYTDTWFPFCNSAFLTRFWAANGGVIDASFEPVSASVFLRHPGLLIHGLLGRLWAPGKDVVVFGRALDAEKQTGGNAPRPA
jgi:2-polyprenyl-3-methyl-5-hydroxy-6-metoxy-1,4-benzoquinol methylase